MILVTLNIAFMVSWLMFNCAVLVVSWCNFRLQLPFPVMGIRLLSCDTLALLWTVDCRVLCIDEARLC